MKLRTGALLAVVTLSIWGFAQTQTQSSSSQSGNGTNGSHASASASSSSSSSKSANGFGSGSQSGNQSANGSGQQGSLPNPTHAVLYAAGPNYSDSLVRMDQSRLMYFAQMQSQGKVLYYGPWKNMPGAMAIIVAKDDAEAQSIVSGDPAVKSQALVPEIRGWNVQVNPFQGVLNSR